MAFGGKDHVGRSNSMDKLGISHISTKTERHKTKSVVATIRCLGFSDSELDTAVSRLEDIQEDVTYDSLIDMAHLVQNEMIETGSAPTSLNYSTHRQSDILSPAHGDMDTRYDCDPEDMSGDLGSEHEHLKKIKTHRDEDLHRLALQNAIAKKKAQLTDAIEGMIFRCRVCNTSRANILLLPCAHLVSCEDCLMDVRRCPMPRCNKIVKGTKEVYFV